MKYIFVINGREDIRQKIEDDLSKQLDGVKIEYEKYYTTGIGDGIRFVRIYCDLHQDEVVCFIACGGTGTINEVASGIVGFKHKSMATLEYGDTSDFLKCFPGRDFHSLAKILDGELMQLDIIKANDNYSLNVINMGFDSYVVHEAQENLTQGMDAKKSYQRAIIKAIFGHRYNHIQVIADGVPLNKRRMLLCVFGNGKWCGGQYICTPNAVLDDGLIEVCLFKTCSLISFILLLDLFKKGTHIDHPFGKKRVVYTRAKNIQVRSKDLIYLCPDGEITASTSFDITVLPKEINFILPA